MISATNGKITMREFSEISYSNKMIGQQINKLTKKFNQLKDINIDCYANDNHYTKFKLLAGNKPVWFNSKGDDFYCEDLYGIDLNKLLVCTYRTMCNMMEGTDINDTPEDILAYAEQKLKEMISNENLD